ncbi:dipeptide ABC transporter ATP-binding protein DppD, partial [Candidatus Micrarchaeota archaeon]
MGILLEIKGLHVRFILDGVTVRAVDGVNLEINENETLALVG